MKQTSTPRVNYPFYKSSWKSGILTTICIISLLQASAQSSCTSTITSDFNGTSIPSGRYVWFNAHFKVNGLTTNPTTIDIDNGSISFTANGSNYNLAVPRATVTFSSANTSSTYTFDNNTQRWLINVPYNVNNNVFFGGLAYSSPGLPGGINPVTWTTTFTSAQTGLTLDWQWGAAVYTQFSSNYNQLGVTVADGSGGHAGSPENYSAYSVGGARGGGAANTTGSWSATGHSAPCSCSGNGSVEGIVWNDLSNPVPDGIHQSSEPGIANVTVKLYNSSNTLLATTVTNGSGHYIFNNVNTASGLTVAFTKPLGYDFTQKNATGSTPQNNSDANPGSGKTDAFTLSGCQHLQLDAGLICNICTPTAVALGSLKTSYQDGKVNLNWNTFSEHNSGLFEIERSTNGSDFISIGTVSAHGNSSSAINYYYADHNPLNGVVYYRLAEKDANGLQITYSNIASVNVLVKGFTITGSPNPFGDRISLTIVSEKAEPYTLKIFDGMGREVFSQSGITIPGSSQVTLNNLSKLQKGMYILDARSSTSSAHVQMSKE